MASLLKRGVHRLQWVSHRLKKQAIQLNQNRGQQITPRPLFILGAQRSGTNMLIEVLDKSPDTWLYNESNLQAFYDNYRIKNHDVRRRLIERATCQWVVFKPLSDSQYADHLLDSYPGSKGIWIYRDYRDVANSAQRKWGSGQKWLVTQLATKDHYPHWFCERVPDDVLATVKRLYREDISEVGAAVLKWYVRNSFYFTLDLASRGDQVLFIKYEELVMNPREGFGQVFDFLGIPFDPSYTTETFTSSVGKESFPEIDPEIIAACDEMMAKLDAHLETTR